MGTDTVADPIRFWTVRPDLTRRSLALCVSLRSSYDFGLALAAPVILALARIAYVLADRQRTAKFVMPYSSADTRACRLKTGLTTDET